MIITAFKDTGLTCRECRGKINHGHQYEAKPWPSRGGFDYSHTVCPEPQRSLDPSRRVVQGTPTPRAAWCREPLPPGGHDDPSLARGA